MVNHKRIAKNTLLLYLRMALIMLIGLVASRVVLSSLGAVDFGLYNVIGGIVVALSFMSGAMNASCNRYYSMALGKEDQPLLHEVFKANLLIYAIFCLAVLVICETLGLWLLNAKLVIPVERMGAARWVYQFSIVTFVSGLLAIPMMTYMGGEVNPMAALVYAGCWCVSLIGGFILTWIFIKEKDLVKA